MLTLCSFRGVQQIFELVTSTASFENLEDNRRNETYPWKHRKKDDTFWKVAEKAMRAITYRK